MLKSESDVAPLAPPHPVSAFQRVSFSAFQVFSICLLAFLFLPTRLIQEANPEWRLVSWALALEVIGITLLTIRMVSDQWPVICHQSSVTGGQSSVIRHPSSVIRISAFQHFSISAFAFPICFFLVAVPWPTVIEAPLIQALTRGNASCAIELLNLSGTPALRHGNLIEIGAGVVNIDEACSGIRSFQATLMISLFLGELYRLTVLRRLSLCLAGFALSFVFNVSRTTLLTWVAGQDGIAAIQRWHDPAGGIILVLCFITLWLLALCLRAIRGQASALDVGVSGLIPSAGTAGEHLGASHGTARLFDITNKHRPWDGGTAPQGDAPLPPAAPPILHSPFCILHSPFPTPAVGLLIWFLLCEISVAGWYRVHEARLPHAAKWTVNWPTNNPSFRNLGIDEKTRQYLRHDEGRNASWAGPDGLHWQMIFLRWNPGKIALHLARGHTPHACLPASGRRILSTTDLAWEGPHGLTLPFRHYVADDAGRRLHVFYCLWEDRGTEQHLRAMGLTLRNRLEPVLAGRRNLGQRSLEVAIWGIADPQEAEAALAQRLETLVRVEKGGD